MIDFRTEQLIPLQAAPQHLPRTRPGRKIHRATVYRWALHGLRGVQLETIKVGGARFTSLEAISRFINEVTTAARLGPGQFGLSIDHAAGSKARPENPELLQRISQILYGSSGEKEKPR